MIKGEKVIIRQLEQGDEVKLHEWRNNDEGNLYCGLNHGFLLSLDAMSSEVRKYVQNAEVFPGENMFMILNKQNMKPIGDISYRNWDKRNRSAEIGIEIGEIGERVSGYGYDALYHFIKFMFGYLNLNRIELQTLSDNVIAQHVYEKLGFKKSGVMRKKSFDSIIGEYTDVLYMDLLRSEFNII